MFNVTKVTYHESITKIFLKMSNNFSAQKKLINMHLKL